MVWGIELDGGAEPAGEAEVDVEDEQYQEGEEHVFGVGEV